MINILILEDDLYISHDLKQIVDSLEGYCGFIASDLPTALKIAQNNAIQIVLADIHIKGDVDGIDTAYMLQNIYQCKVIFLTSFNDEDTLNKAIKVDFSGYILKPFRENELTTKLKLCVLKSSIPIVNLKINDAYYFNQKQQQLFKNDEFIELTLKEKQLFLLLFYTRGKVVPFYYIDEIIWQENLVNDTTRRQLFHRLKQKLPELSFKSVKYLGYMLEN